MSNELQQTKGIVKIRGLAVGLENPNFYREGVTDQGEYKALSLAVKTAPDNIIYNLDLVGFYLNRKVKVFSNKNKEWKSIEIDFEDRHNLPEGFTPLGFGTVRVNLERGVNKPKNLFNWDAIDVIKNSLKENDSIYVTAEFNPNTYTTPQGEKRTNVKYTVTGIGFLKNPIDFESEDFKEVASFEQEMVVIDKNIDKDRGKLYIVGRLIRFNKKWDDVIFSVDANKYKTLANNINKRTKFGDIIKAQGIIKNKVEIQEIEQTEELDWGGESPEGIGRSTITNRIKELEITNVVSHKPGIYKEEDFVNNEDPFVFNDSGLEGESIDLSDDDFPF